MRDALWFLESSEVFDGFIREWRDGTLPKEEFTHAAHIAVGAWMAVEHPGDAFERTRDGILRYNAATGTANTATSGYHETLTRFWSHLIAANVRGISDPLAAARHAVQTFAGRRGIYGEYYSFDVVGDAAARVRWLAPDLAEL